MQKDKTIKWIPIKNLVPHPNNPRKNLGELEELSASISANGVRQNLMIYPVDAPTYRQKTGIKKAYNGDYYILAGHRRHAASKIAGLKELPCAIYDNLTM
ncbi:MAG: ParB/RepB/Spo0J family partition protein, partial [Defluviitaleaceae bacterium]|nr:ParB/RepB/Spo0J family partition protein [Defluviitaleaceae bacterium]MCL2264395.1 ParB/RepB/Spo0J family partition protein [Defluviitaleaceae bacterium]